MKWDAEKYDAVKAPQIDAGRELIALAQAGKSDAILDLGCGTGKLTVELARLAPKGRVTGMDPSREMLDKAREVTAGMENVRLMELAAQDMNFTDEFDLVFSNSALQWVTDQENALGRIARSMKKDGRLVFQVPARNFCPEFFKYTKETIALLHVEDFYSAWESPWRFFTKEEYTALLRDAGFVDMKIFYRDYRLRFDDTSAVLDWWASAGLRPYLAPLPGSEQEQFKKIFADRFERNRTESGIEFDFRRIFASAEKVRKSI